MEHQQARDSWTALLTPEGQFKKIRVWNSDMLAAEAKKVEWIGEDTCLIPNTLQNWKAGLDPLKIAKVNVTNGRDSLSEKVISA